MDVLQLTTLLKNSSMISEFCLFEESQRSSWNFCREILQGSLSYTTLIDPSLTLGELTPPPFLTSWFPCEDPFISAPLTLYLQLFVSVSFLSTHLLVSKGYGLTQSSYSILIFGRTELIVVYRCQLTHKATVICNSLHLLLWQTQWHNSAQSYCPTVTAVRNPKSVLIGSNCCTNRAILSGGSERRVWFLALLSF